ncbi:MAG TPA: EamA family transporter [Thermodesulfobacteriota bacterium]|nr:EamA family transporter [Thermodesulfobacteriota bacterium]
MERWFWMALGAILLWGLGSFLGKVALMKDIPYRVYLFEGIGTLTILSSFILFKRQVIFTDFSFNILALLMGITWGLGTILFIIALKPAKLSVLVPLSAVYPAVTILLSLIFLHERLETREIIGVVFAILSVMFLAR